MFLKHVINENSITPIPEEVTSIKDFSSYFFNSSGMVNPPPTKKSYNCECENAMKVYNKTIQYFQKCFQKLLSVGFALFIVYSLEFT